MNIQNASQFASEGFKKGQAKYGSAPIFCNVVVKTKEEIKEQMAKVGKELQSIAKSLAKAYHMPGNGLRDRTMGRLEERRYALQSKYESLKVAYAAAPEGNK